MTVSLHCRNTPIVTVFQFYCCMPTLQSYTIGQLRALVETATGQRLDELQFQQKEGKVVEEWQDGRQLTLQDSGIKKEDTLFLMNVGFVLNITDPQVQAWK